MNCCLLRSSGTKHVNWRDGVNSNFFMQQGTLTRGSAWHSAPEECLGRCTTEQQFRSSNFMFPIKFVLFQNETFICLPGTTVGKPRLFQVLFLLNTNTSVDIPNFSFAAVEHATKQCTVYFKCYVKSPMSFFWGVSLRHQDIFCCVAHLADIHRIPKWQR